MAEHDITLVTAKAGTVIAENLKLSLATPAGAITPSTITAMVGIAQGKALDLAPTVKSAMSAMDARISALITANTAPSLALAARITSAKANLTSLQSQILPSGNHASFGQVLRMAQSHIGDSMEIKKATNFMQSTSFAECGAGITNMSSMATQGLDGVMGNLNSAAAAFEAAGPIANLSDMKNFGSPAGLVNKLSSVKLGNASGVNEVLAKSGVDLTQLDDPVYKDTIAKSLSSITDPKIISTVTTQLGISPPGAIGNLGELTDLKKLASPSAVAGLTGGLSGMASKFSDMGAKFASPSAAATMLKNIEIPSIPSLNASVPDLAAHVTGLLPDIKSMTGMPVGLSALNGADNLPSITDFTHVVSGGPELSALTTGVIDDTAIDALENSLTKTTALLGNAGIDLTEPPPPSMGSAMTFATSLHTLGADADVATALKSMAASGSNAVFGDSIKASLAEGKNKALMMAHGISPLKFG